MQLNDYLEATHTTAIYPEAGTGSDLELYYLSLGLTSEAGEVAGKVKKLIRDGTYDPGGLAYELGDVFWYLVRLCDAIGYEPQDILTININKLLKRKQNNSLSGSGDDR
jgi:NTP pyrophosphatase (non-canonical NTP hydrolase)